MHSLCVLMNGKIIKPAMGFLSFGQDKTADSLGGVTTMKRGIFQADALPEREHSCVTNAMLE